MSHKLGMLASHYRLRPSRITSELCYIIKKTVSSGIADSWTQVMAGLHNQKAIQQPIVSLFGSTAGCGDREG